MAPQARFERARVRLTGGCSATELLRNESGGPGVDLNPQPSACRADVLPLELQARGALSWFRATLSCSSGRRFHQISLQGEMERMAGNDPAAPCLASRRSATELHPHGGRGTDSNLRTHKGPDLQSGCFGLLHTRPYWLREPDSNRRPRGYEPRELPLLHPAIIGGRLRS
jgi:hypothetical protein